MNRETTRWQDILLRKLDRAIELGDHAAQVMLIKRLGHER